MLFDKKEKELVILLEAHFSKVSETLLHLKKQSIFTWPRRVSLNRRGAKSTGLRMKRMRSRKIS